MNRSPPLVLALVMALAACDSGPTEPADAAGTYVLESVNGIALPAFLETFTTPDSRSCTTRVVQGNLSLGEQVFDLDLSVVMLCDGQPTASGDDRTSGTYVQVGSRVTFQTRYQGPTHVGTADLVNGKVHMTAVRNSGTEADLVFRRQ
jgi:hypothetical protein